MVKSKINIMFFSIFFLLFCFQTVWATRIRIELETPISFNVKEFAKSFPNYEYVGPEKLFPDREMIFNNNNKNLTTKYWFWFLWFGKKVEGEENLYREIATDFPASEIEAQIISACGTIPTELIEVLEKIKSQETSATVTSNPFATFINNGQVPLQLQQLQQLDRQKSSDFWWA